jgi:hypothetical protein
MTNKKIATRRARKSSSPPDRIMALARRYGPDGRVFTLADFSRLGSDASVRKVLSRLVKAGKLHRVCQGLYFLPSVSNLLGVPASPDPDAIVYAIARRDRVAIFPDNAVAAKDVGFTDAVPDKTVYLTTGNPKTISIGRNTIKIKKATWPVAAVAKSSAAVRIVQALEWLGRKRALRAADNLAIEAGVQRARFVCGSTAKVDATCGARVVRRPEAQATTTRGNEKRTTLKVTVPLPNAAAEVGFDEANGSAFCRCHIVSHAAPFFIRFWRYDRAMRAR